MPERTWVTFIVGAQAQPGRKMRVGEGTSQVWTVKERVLSGRPPREHIVWAEGGGIPVAFARRKRWQIEVWAP
jgi:hypothetical protein